MSETRKYLINYGFCDAELWTDCGEDTVEKRFMELAKQCFGIRKSIAGFTLIGSWPEDLPRPWADVPGAAEVLKHSGDTIVWNDDGEKIKSEFD